MPSIAEVTEELASVWELNKRERGILFSMLDDSDDDSPTVQEVEGERNELELAVERALRKRNAVARFLQHIARDDAHPAIYRRQALIKDVKKSMTTYSHTSKLRAEEAETSSVTRYAFNVYSPQGASSASSVSPRQPQFTWMLQFKKLQVPGQLEDEIWTEQNYNEGCFRVWWRRKNTSQVLLESDGWSDMKRIARRVVIQILERIRILTCPHLKHLKMISERAREIVLYQIILCYNLPQDGMSDLQELFEYTAPIIYLVSRAVQLSAAVPSNGIAESYSIEKKLQKLDPYIRELRKRCYLLGDKIGFDVYQYKDEFRKGAIFDFEDGEDDGVGLDHRIAGADKDEYIKCMDNIGQKQLLINENAQKISSLEEAVSDVGSVVKLVANTLREIGLTEFTDIIYDSQKWKGSGGYADVYEMERTGDSIPVAVKVIRPCLKYAKRIEREARIWIKIKHKHIAPLLGFVSFDSLLGGQPCLVSELYHTDLRHLVKEHGRNGSETKGLVLTEERRLRFLRDVVFALDHLHAMHIAHGDLRAANVLVTNGLLDDPSCYAVLNDFGMSGYDDNGVSSILDGRDLSSVNQRTSEYWLAPELFEKTSGTGSLSRVSIAGDVYAFGVVFLEVMYERDPYEGSCYNVAYAKSVGELPAKKEDVVLLDDLHWTLMQGCWRAVEDRRNIQEVACELLLILDNARA